MNVMTSQQAFQVLRRAGCVKAEIDRLYQLRRDYQTNELDQPPLDLCRLQFIRWLVATGRLTDQLPEMSKVSSGAPPQHGGRLWTILARFPFSSLRRKESRHL